MRSPGRITLRALFVVVLGLTIAAVVVAFRPQTRERQLAEGLSEQVVASGLRTPTSFRFSPDGRIFVAEKSGRILVFARPGGTHPTLFADLSREVYDVADHGLLSLALDPAFPASRTSTCSIPTTPRSTGRRRAGRRATARTSAPTRPACGRTAA